MRIFFLLSALFITIPLIELTLLLLIGSYTRWWVSLLLVIISGIAGALVARYQGWKTMSRIRSEIAARRIPGDALLDGVFILMAGAMLLTPGVLTDAVGMSMMLPFIRKYYKAWIVSWVKSRFRFSAASPFHGDPTESFGGDPRNVVQGEVVRETIITSDDADEEPPAQLP